MNRLHRIPEGAVLGGVCAGLARYFRIDVTLVRLIFVLGFFLTHGPFGIVYLILWIALPTGPQPGVDWVADANAVPPPTPPFTPNQKVWGGVLIGLGVLFLLDEFVWWFSWGKLWPLALVALGLYLIFRDRVPDPFRRTDAPNSSESNSPQNPL